MPMVVNKNYIETVVRKYIATIIELASHVAENFWMVRKFIFKPSRHTSERTWF